MAMSLAFVLGVPAGIFIGACVGAVVEIFANPPTHSAAWGLLSGVGSALVVGALAGRWNASRKYKWVHHRLNFPTPVSVDEWQAAVMALNVEAAWEHHLLVRHEPNYVAYTPTLVRPVTAGPLTVSGEYLSVMVARLNETTITITGPREWADKFSEVVKKALEASGSVPE